MHFYIARHVVRKNLILRHSVSWDAHNNLSKNNWFDASDPNDPFHKERIQRVALDDPEHAYKIMRDAYFHACRNFDQCTYYLKNYNNNAHASYYKQMLDALANEGFTGFPSVAQQKAHWKDIGNTIVVVKIEVDPINMTIKEVEEISLKDYGPRKITPVKRKFA